MPVLTFREALTQIWLNQYTLLLLVLAAKLLLFRSSLAHALAAAQTQTLEACTRLETLAEYTLQSSQAAATVLDFAFDCVAAEFQRAVAKTVMLAVQAAKAVIVFAIRMVVGTYACLVALVVTLAVTTALDASTAVVETANKTIGALADDIQQAVNGMGTAVEGVLSAVDAVKGLFTGTNTHLLETKFELVNLTILLLRHWSIPPTVTDTLKSVELKVPSFASVEDSLAGLVEQPLTELVALVNRLVSRPPAVFNVSLPPVKRLTLCASASPEIVLFYGLAQRVVRRSANIMAAVLVVVAVLAMVPLAYDEWRQYKRVDLVADRVVESDGALRPVVWEALVDIQHRLADSVARMLPTPYPATKWFASYMLLPRSLTVLSVGLGGSVAVGLQFLLLREAEAALQGVGPPISAMLGNVSEILSHEAGLLGLLLNSKTNATQQAVNENVLGWADAATTAVNSSVFAFGDHMTGAINSTLGGTFLYAPVLGAVYCVLGRRLEEIERGLTWVHDHAVVRLPMVGTEVARWMQQSTGGLEQAGEGAASALQSAGTRTIQWYRHSLHAELWVLLAVVGAWALNGAAATAVYLARRNASLLSSSPPYPTPTKPPSSLRYNTYWDWDGERRV